MFSYLSPNTEQIPVVTDIRNLLKHSPENFRRAAEHQANQQQRNSGDSSSGQKHCPSHFYQYHQHLQYQSQYQPRAGSWSSSPENDRKLRGSPQKNGNSAAANQNQKPSMFSFNFLNKTKDQSAANHQKNSPKGDDRERREKKNAAVKEKHQHQQQQDRNKDKEKAKVSADSRLIANYLSKQRSQKFGLTLQQQYFQSQQQKLQQHRQAKHSSNSPSPPHQVPSRRILESHSYQNVSDEDRRQQTPPLKQEQSSTSSPGSNQQMFRKFGDTNLMPRNNNNPGSNYRKGDFHVDNGVFRYSPHITSFAELDYENRNLSKFLNIDVKSASNSSAYSSGSSPSQNNNLTAANKKASNRSSPNLNHIHQSNSSASSVLSDKSSCSTSSLDQRSYFIGEQPSPHEYGSYLGPFNFRQLLRPIQGPTESLRKRKGINSNSPPPPQRGKSFI